MRDQQDRPMWIQQSRAMLIALAIAVGVGLASGAINGWAVGAYEGYILEQQEHYEASPAGIRRYVRMRTMHFALPLTIGGVIAYLMIRRIALADGYPLLLPLALGALAGWACAGLVGAAVAEEWPPGIRSTLILPSVLFVAIPAVMIWRDS